jgi:hypothetical protein
VGLQAQQIVNLACQAASCPGYTAQAGQLLNVILQELCQTYDFDTAKRFYTFNFDPGLATLVGNAQIGSGPYPLPADFLRCVGSGKDCYWTLLGVPYPMIPIDLSEFDMTVQQAGLASYPYWFCTDVSPNDSEQQGLAGQAFAYVYPPPSGAYPVFLRYYSQMPDIVTPETSTVVPWFPNTQYLRTRLTGELFAITDDERAVAYLGDTAMGAQGILNRYLKLKDDKSDRAQTVQLDRRRFSGNFQKLRNTKTVGW